MTHAEAADIFGVIQARLSARLHLAGGTITRETRFTEDLGVDSVTAVELLMELEDRYGVIVADEEAVGLSTVGQAADFIAGRLSGES